MGDEWENAGWDEEAREAFFKRIRRQRGKRIERYLLKAGHLFESGLRDRRQAAMEMLEQLVQDYEEHHEPRRAGQSYENLYKEDILDCLHRIAVEQARDDDLEAASASWDRLIAIVKDDFAKARWGNPHYRDWARLLHRQGRSPLKALRRYKSAAIDRTTQYDAPTVAREFRALGYPDRARAIMERWRDWSRIPAYEDYAQRAVLSHDDEPYASPEDAAETIVVYHHATLEEVFVANAQAVDALQQALRRGLGDPEYRVDSYQDSFLLEHLTPELGAYLGRVLVQSYGGQWSPATPLMSSRVMLDDQHVDPFLAAYNFVFLDDPLDALLPSP